MSLEKIRKLSDKEVEKYFNRYQKVAGQKMANGLVDSAISTATKVISCFLPIDDTEKLCSDLQNDELVKRELSNIAALLVVRGGRLVALGSALFQVPRHIKFNRVSDSEASEAAIEASEPAGEKQNRSWDKAVLEFMPTVSPAPLADFKIFKIILKGVRYSLK